MINVDKLFRRLSIRSKLIIAFVALGVIPVLVIGGYGASYSFSLLSRSLHDRLRSAVAMKAENIQGLLDHTKDEALMLSRLPALLHLVDLQAGAVPDLRRRLVAQVEEDFLAFSRAHEAYYQVRYIDERGREIVRADFDGHASLLVPPDRLQDKTHRYYFQEAMEVAPGEVYVSPMDLNIERGVVEVPHKPVVRYATALVNSRGERKGVVIINIYASSILSEVLALGQEKGDISLANSSGFYLSRSEWTRAGRNSPGSGDPPFPSWLASYAERLRPRQNLSGLGPEQWLLSDLPSGPAATILSGNTGTIVEPGLRGRIVAFAPIFPQKDRQGEFWVLVHAYRKTEVVSSIRSLQILVLMLGGGVLVVALVVGVAAARRFTRPITELIRGADAVALGDFDRPIRVETNDEIEDLAHRFNLMTQKLKDHKWELQRAHERLEMKAREAGALYKIGTEISAFLDLDKILCLVADKARELLGSDIATLCLLTKHDEELVVGATSGPPDAFSLGRGEKIADGPGRIRSSHSPEGDGELKDCNLVCPGISDQYLKSRLAVPLKTGYKMIGALCVGDRAPREFIQKDVDLLSGLASQAAIAIENARLHGQVRSLAALEERERISKDLHDGIIQSIYVTGLGLEECVRLVGETPGEIKTRLEQLIDGLNVVIRDVRNYIVGLGPERLHDRDLDQALSDLARGLSLNALLDVDLSVEPGIDGALTPEQVGHLYHICREVLTNVVKHAMASRVALTIDRGNGVLLLTVKDDGVGFDPSHQAGTGQGIRNMRERAQRLGGSLNIESKPGLGTRITVEVPLEEAV